ncbi:MAG: hypothetical protein OES79_12540, partial [Planctomycetota bacterium]|nr:hypothetical protein [Planctomycetota bacterium]
MFNYHVTFDSPWYLLLAGVLPLLWVFSYHSLAGLGSVRRAVAIAWRTLVMLLLILAIADMRLVRISDRLTVIYLLDQSESIPRPARVAMVEYTRRAVQEHRDAARRDRAAVIVFGRKPDVEIGPID